MLNLLMTTHEFVLGKVFSLLLKTGRSPYNFRPSMLMRNLKSLLTTQWQSLDELHSIQLAKARRLLGHARQHVPYYQELFDQAGFDQESLTYMDQLAALPVLTKNIIQEQGDRLLSTAFSPSEYYRNHTGGSTGEPLTFYHSWEYESWGLADIWRNFFMCGYRPGERKVFFWGSDYDATHHKGFRERILNDLLHENMVWINTFDLSEELLDRSVTLLRLFRPRFLVAYVSSATLLARYLKDHGITDIRLRAIQTSAEVLTTAQRRLLEEVFGCQVFDRYGCREVGNIAHECDAHDGLHLLCENNYSEFLVDGRSTTQGETGLITVTNLNNLAMPFIRYQPGDLGRPSGRKCSCGRQLPLMEMVDGRSTDVIETPSGKLLHGEFFTHLFYKLKHIRQFQVVQQERDLLVVKIVPLPGFEQEQTVRFLTDAICTHGDAAFRLEFNFLPAIPPAPSGKFRFVYRAANLN